MRSKKSLLQILDTNWLMLEDAFLLGVHIVLGIDIQQTSFIFCKNAEGVKTISFLYQDCCIILIQHIRSFFLLMEFEASEYVLDFTNHGKKSRNNIMRYFWRCPYLLLIDDLQASLLRNFLIQGRIWSYKIQCDVLTLHLDDSSHQTHGTILSAHKEVHLGPEGWACHPSLWANLVIHCFACLPKCCSEI